MPFPLPDSSPTIAEFHKAFAPHADDVIALLTRIDAKLNAPVPTPVPVPVPPADTSVYGRLASLEAAMTALTARVAALETAGPAPLPTPPPFPVPTPTPTPDPVGRAFPFTATIYSKTDINDKAGKDKIAKHDWYVTDLGWWPDTGWSGGSGELGISVGAYLKKVNPKMIATLYWHSCIYEIGQAEPGTNNWRASETGWYVGGKRYRQPFEWLACGIGSRLSAAITTSATSVDVADGSRFKQNEYARIGMPGLMELVRVGGVNGNTLTVERGREQQNTAYVNKQITDVGGGYPARAHPANAPIVPVLYAFGDSTWALIDVTDTCTDADGGFGMQTYAEWQADFLKLKLSEPHFTNLDGIFHDNFLPNPGAIFGDMGRADPAYYSPAKWDAGMRNVAAKTRAALPGKIITGNTGGLADPFGQWLDGGMVEGLRNLDNPFIAEQYGSVVAFLRTWGKVGPYTILNATAASAADPAARASVALACVMGIAIAVDGYGPDGLNGSGHQETWWIPEYDAKLGTISGPIVDLGNGVLRRDFTNGTALVNTGSNSLTVALNGTFMTLGGQAVTSAALPAKDGILLRRA